MELTLTRRWVEHKSNTETKEIYHGLRVEYYGNGSVEGGEIISTPKEFAIMWDDTDFDTPLDGSDKSNNILKHCGFEWV